MLFWQLPWYNQHTKAVYAIILRILFGISSLLILLSQGGLYILGHVQEDEFNSEVRQVFFKICFCFCFVFFSFFYIRHRRHFMTASTSHTAWFQYIWAWPNGKWKFVMTNFHVSLPHWRSTTDSLENKPFQWKTDTWRSGGFSQQWKVSITLKTELSVSAIIIDLNHFAT